MSDEPEPVSVDELEQRMVESMRQYLEGCAGLGMSQPEIMGRASGAMMRAFG